MDEELCVVVTLESPERAEQLRSRLPAGWNAVVEGSDVVVAAESEADAEAIERAIQSAIAADPVPVPGAATATEHVPGTAAGTEIAGGVIGAIVEGLRYL